jgi:hypothetical protein
MRCHFFVVTGKRWACVSQPPPSVALSSATSPKQMILLLNFVVLILHQFEVAGRAADRGYE